MAAPGKSFCGIDPMTLYALIVADGDEQTVRQLYTPPAGHEMDQMYHPDLDWQDVTSVAGIAEGWIATVTNGVYSYAAPPPPPPPTIEQQGLALLVGGLTVAFNPSAALSGTYDCSPDWQNKLTATALYCQINGKFPGAKTSIAWPDTTGGQHSFDTTAKFIALSTAIGDFVALCDEVIGGQSSVLPPNTVTIDL
jgi:hypothetical protein